MAVCFCVAKKSFFYFALYQKANHTGVKQHKEKNQKSHKIAY